jgi:glycosyltransferase involved in cell wall biosynthesis
MNICVLSVTRDRLAYSKHCFRTLRDTAGCEYDHFVFDNGSKDGTWQWLMETDEHDFDVIGAPENIGISPALNILIDRALAAGDYDVVVKVDNDAEILTPNTLKGVCESALGGTFSSKWPGAIVSPHIRGLRATPQVIGTAAGKAGPDISVTNVIGGVFTAVPAWIFSDGYRHPILPTLDGEDFNLCRWFCARGGVVGYVDGYEANHYETTDGQHARYPDYFARREQERDDAKRLVTW